MRSNARRAIGRFIEVFADCPLEVCAARDEAGNRAEAIAAEIERLIYQIRASAPEQLSE